MGAKADTATSVGLAAPAVAVALLALNLRPGITTVGPVLDSVIEYFGAGVVAAGLITAAPVIAFAVVSLATPFALARISLRHGLYAALALIGVSLAVRPWGDLAVFVVATFTSALGVGLLGVLLPAVIRAVGNTRTLVSSFTTALQAGAALGFAAAVPLSTALGGWRWGLAVWAVLAPIGILAVRYSPLGAGEARPESAVENPVAVLRRTRMVGLAVFFGLQALLAFVVIGWLPSVLADAGIGAQAAGGYLGILTCTAVPISLIVPPIVARSAHPSRWLSGFSACSALGVLGFALAPAAAPLLWSLVLGVGLSVFSLVLTVVTVRAGSTGEAIGLSAAVQGFGYLLAAVGPYAFGVLREVDAGWGLPLGALLATAVVQTLVGYAVGDPEPADQNEAKTVGGNDI